MPKVLHFHSCIAINQWWRWRCVNCDKCFRKHPSAKTCRGPRPENPSILALKSGPNTS
jgi:hypothetical protein